MYVYIANYIMKCKHICIYIYITYIYNYLLYTYCVFLQVWIIIYILCFVCLYVYVYVFIWLYVLSLFFGRLHLGSLACAPLFFGQVEPGHWWQQIALSHARISNLELIQVLHSLGLGENLNRKPCFSHENHGTWWFRISNLGHNGIYNGIFSGIHWLIK
jgi:hypothetical protein